MTYRILNLEPQDYSDAARQILRQVGELDEKPLSRAELLACIGEYDVLVVRLAHQIDRAVIETGRRLKAIVSATTGLDHIDLAAARENGIAVLSLRGETEFLDTIPATAEHTWALLLALIRRIPQAFASVLQGEWNRDRFRGHDLAGKNLGIVGLGRIGRKVARYALAFEMQVHAYDPHTDRWLEDVTRQESLEDLLRLSQILTLHVPLEERTRGLIGRRELARLPAGAILINTSRGEVVDEVALVEALESGHLAGAALDVVHHERQPEMRSNNPLLAYARSHDNLLLTPHIGGATWESMGKTEIFVARKLQKVLTHAS